MVGFYGAQTNRARLAGKPAQSTNRRLPGTRTVVRLENAIDIAAHALWAGAGVVLLARHRPLPVAIGVATVALAVLPDLMHMLPVAAWTMFNGLLAEFMTYVRALPERVQPLPESVELWSHHLHCMFHSGVIATVVTLTVWLRTRRFWLPLAGWWSHILIDVLTHSDDFFPSPVLYPLTYRGFDGVAWNAPWFVVANYSALVIVWGWLLVTRRKRDF
ncbi:MAG: hypothetical protein U1C04_08450 [Hydrogenophaga sp.]|uniref:hypothetical protein n=1 Tax=Hydrogenophaga sp. TaxID=1904254 RepID=UPI002AB97894|nr:hypothetical protein [Hydrogenophaga sp.]MDZ4280790.1 hypothetical protein [Hydrogenophaga sp.]